MTAGSRRTSSRCSLADRPSLREHVDPLAQPHDQTQVVVDDEHRAALVVADAAGSSRAARPTPPRSSPPRARRGAGSGAAGERARDLDPPLLAVGERDREPVAVGRRGGAARAARRPARRRARARRRLPRRSPRRSSPRTAGSAGTCGRRRAARTRGACCRSRRRRRSRSRPAVGRRTPLATLRSVVLPLPFGPISPTISPSSTYSETPSSARRPRKCLATSSTASASSMTRDSRCSGSLAVERGLREGPLA